MPLLVIERGKSIKEGIEGWAGLYEMVFPGKKKRMAHLLKMSQAIESGLVSIRVAALFRSSQGRWPTVWISNEEEPDEKIALLVCLGSSLEKALEHLEASGATFAYEPRVNVGCDSFKITWRNHLPSGDVAALFDFNGEQIGDWVADNMTEDQLIEALKEINRRRAE